MFTPKQVIFARQKRIVNDFFKLPTLNLLFAFHESGTSNRNQDLFHAKRHSTKLFFEDVSWFPIERLLFNGSMRLRRFWCQFYEELYRQNFIDFARILFDIVIQFETIVFLLGRQ